MELGEAVEQYLDLSDAIQNEMISNEVLLEIILRSIIDKEAVVKKISEIYKKNNRKKDVENWEKINRIVNQKIISIAYSGRT